MTMTRKGLLKFAGYGAFGAALGTLRAARAAPPPLRPAIKITDVKPFVVWSGVRNAVFVKVETDQGIHGIGEAYSCGPDEATAKVILVYKSWLVGQDPRNIEHLWAMMYNFTRFPPGFVVGAAISGIEHALWDIAGKAAGLPVYMLLGGKCRDRIRVYTSVPNAAAAIQGVQKHGYTAFKTRPEGINKNPYNQVTRDFGKKMRTMRAAVGPDVDIGVDVHAQFFELSRALRLAKEIEPYNPMWLEEAIRPENAAVMARLRERIDIPLASGEANYTKYEFQKLLAADALDIVQPDLCLCGGLLEGKKIAAMAEAHYVTIAPHNPNGPLGTVASAHFCAATPNFKILEHIPDDEAPRKDLLKEPLAVKKGHFELSSKPGFGVELNEEAFKHYPPRPWHRDFELRPDGSVGFI